METLNVFCYIFAQSILITRKNFMDLVDRAGLVVGSNFHFIITIIVILLLSKAFFGFDFGRIFRMKVICNIV